MAKKKKLEGRLASGPDGADKVKATTCQLYADVVFWANLIVALNPKIKIKINGIEEEIRNTLARLLDPVVRPFVRETLISRGIDPDERWAQAQSSPE